MDPHQKSIESQLHMRCGILEWQVETLEKQNSELSKKNTTKRSSSKIMGRDEVGKMFESADIDDLPFKVNQPTQWKEIEGVGEFPVEDES